MENNRDFNRKRTPSSNTYYWWYGLYNALYVAFPVIAVGPPQIIRPHKNTSWSLFFQRLCHLNNAFAQMIWKPVLCSMWHSAFYIRWWEECEVFVGLSPILHFHSSNAQHLRMQRPSHEVLQQPTAMCSSKFMPGHTICHIGISRRILKE